MQLCVHTQQTTNNTHNKQQITHTTNTHIHGCVVQTLDHCMDPSSSYVSLVCYFEIKGEALNKE